MNIFICRIVRQVKVMIQLDVNVFVKTGKMKINVVKIFLKENLGTQILVNVLSIEYFLKLKRS